MPPHARKEGLLVQELEDELLVYDLERSVGHCLNPVTALVWQHADGKTGVPEMAALLRDELGMEPDERLVWVALDCLGEAHLLRDEVVVPPEAEGVSRRDLLRRVAVSGGVAAAASFALMSVVAPKPAQAQPAPAQPSMLQPTQE